MAGSADKFDKMLQEMKKEWYEVEATQRRGQAEFFTWFEKLLGQVMKENVISPIQQIAGLGVRHQSFTPKMSLSVVTGS